MSNLKCKICGTEFPAISERHYISRDLTKTGLAAVIQATDEPSLFDAFDCPNCGCQTIVQQRKREFTLVTVEADDNSEKDSESEWLPWKASMFRWGFTSADFLNIGDRIPTTLKTGEEVVFVVVDKAEGRTFFGLEDCLRTEYPMNDTNTNAGGWNASKMRKILNTDIWEELPDDLKACIKPRNIDGEESKLWLFSREEVFGNEYMPCMPYFKRQANRIKGFGKDGETWFWWLRSAHSGITYNFRLVDYSGSGNWYNAYLAFGVVLGFVI